ncbi:RHS repeat domain-containing protein [Chryseobacterium sp.]|uniref:RHS repeat domain-containing protein n=1 Tax=Chryseobacterium sp. TaxID=1871047 RepID=UPI00345B53D8
MTKYICRADGIKVKKFFGDKIEADYLDGFQYKSTFSMESWNGEGTFHPNPNEIPVLKLRIIPTSEGYYDALLNRYVYNYTDHLGNIRLSYTDTNGDGIIQPRRYNASNCTGLFCIDDWRPGEIVDVNNHYPFGLLHNYTRTTQNAYQYKYNGKELQETGMYDYGARFYMPDIGRWGVVDPLAEKTRRWTPYVYAGDNPMRFIDPDGRTWGDPKDEQRLTKNVNNRIADLNKSNAKIQAKIDKGGLSDKQLTKLNTQLADNNTMLGSMNQSLTDIKTIADAKETFYLTGPSQDNGTHGVVKTTGKDGKERINIEGTGSALHLHEIRHVGQSYEAGGMKFNSKGQLKTSAKSFSEGRAVEVEAYKTGYSYDTNSYPVPVKSVNDINEENLMDIKTSDGTQVYKALDVKDK